MWKEKYEALKAEFDELKDAHDELAKRLRGAEVAVRDFELGSAPAAYPVAPGFPVSTASLSKQFQNGDLDALYRYILGRAAKEDLKTLRVLVERPELVVEVKRQTIEANGSTLRGAIAILISEKYFDAVREFSDVRKDLVRRGFLGSKAPNLQISQALQGLVELGFLTKEDTGYQAVPGMKIQIRESAA